MIDKNKQYRTRDGREVRIYAVDGCGDYPVHGASLVDGGWTPHIWSSSGEFWKGAEGTASDLVEVKPEHTRWLVVTPLTGFATKEEAVKEALGCLRWVSPAITVVPVTFREGDGL